jgi:hypothetical protein
VGLIGEWDSAAGYGKWISFFSRLNLISGSDNYALAAAVERLYLNAEVGPVAFEAGRDVLAVGPGARTQLLWSDHAPPLDHVRLSTSHPLKIPRIPVAVSAFYAVGRLRDPQTFHGTLVTLGRLQLDLFNQLELGVAQLLQLGGDGAAPFGFGDFIAEHFTRRDPIQAHSNRRAALDATYTNRWARGLRLYYELVFEDFRKELVDLFVYDCDHLIGAELAALTSGGRHGLTVEYQHNGPFSQVHTYFLTGLSNAGRAVGTPLGPDSWSLYAAARIDVPTGALAPWAELAQIASDQYVEDHGIRRTRTGVTESRLRLGGRAWLRLRARLRVQVRAWYEHVWSAGFIAGAARDNLGLETSLTWEPEIPVAR